MQGLNAVEIVSDCRGDTYRGVYTTRLKGFIYVLHCFQKKSKTGIKTPKRDLALIRTRLADAELHFKARNRPPGQPNSCGARTEPGASGGASENRATARVRPCPRPVGKVLAGKA